MSTNIQKIIIKKFIFDPRTEWSIRWTVLLGTCYACFFFGPPPNSHQWIDWTLPIQLVSGGNLGFYNIGFHIWFCLGVIVSIIISGIILSCIFIFLQEEDQLFISYLILMLILTFLTLPIISSMGILNNLTSIFILLISIFTEVFYGPLLNLRSILPPNVTSIWIEFVRNSIVPTFIYLGFSIAIYIIPPWHTGSKQTLSLISNVLSSIGDIWDSAATSISISLSSSSSSSSSSGGGGGGCTSNHNDDDLEDGQQQQQQTQQQQEGMVSSTKTKTTPTSSTSSLKDDMKLQLLNMSRTLFIETNFAGLDIPINLYGEMGLYEIPNILYPFSCPSIDKLHSLSKQLDITIFHSCICLYMLSSTNILDDIIYDELSTTTSKDDANENENDESSSSSRIIIHKAFVEYLQSSAKVAKSISIILAGPRRGGGGGNNWNDNSSSTKDWREQFFVKKIFESFGGDDDDWIDTTKAKKDLHDAMEAARSSAETLRNAALLLLLKNKKGDDSGGGNNKQASLLWYAVRDLCYGDPIFIHERVVGELLQENESNDDDDDNNKNNNRITTSNEGILGQLADCAIGYQGSYSQKFVSPLRLIYRILFLEQLVIVITKWIDGCRNLFRCTNNNNTTKSMLNDRNFRRGCQYFVGTYGLYAMATWWKTYSSSLGTSSTGQWTMVAFYVCFRATAEETVNASILRAIGHGLGALFSWGMNTWFTTNSGRFWAHVIFNLILTWFIPPPFVYPSKTALPTDKVLGDSGLLEALLTTYHLTTSLIKSTPIADAAKSRALSQCIGAATAAFVSVTIFPLYANTAAKEAATQERLATMIRITNDDDDDDNKNIETIKSLGRYVEDMLQTRRDWNSALEAKGWFIALMKTINKTSLYDEDEDGKISTILARKVIAGFAAESIVYHYNKSGETNSALEDCIKSCRFNDMQTILMDAYENSSSSDEDEERLEHLAICVLASKLYCGTMTPPPTATGAKNSPSSDNKEPSTVIQEKEVGKEDEKENVSIPGSQSIEESL